MAQISKTLAKARKKAGISVYRLAKDADVTPAGIYRVESGEQAGFDVKTAKKLATVLGNVTAAELLGV